ncbi:MAG: hypothetical protein WC878_06345 [Candidatus Paceibacterota bacterium]|jgi:hypothetical protein
MNAILKLEKYRSRLFFLFLLFLVVGFLGKDNYKNIIPDEANPEIFRDPVQTSVASATPIEFQKDGFSYKLTPLYDYRISGLAVHRLDYDNWYSLSRTDETFTTDICMLWGENLKSGAYKNKTLTIDQDFRFCLFSYWGGQPINNDQFSNNHLIIRNEEIKKINAEISPGDQIRITGKLVNVEAYSLGKVKKYEPTKAKWTTSTTRNDSGAGACEIVYVEKIEILKKGNIAYHMLYRIVKYGISFIILWIFAQFIRYVFLVKRN